MRDTQYTIEQSNEQDLDEANEVRLQSWIDTYPNEELGITEEWVEARNQDQRSPEKHQARLERLSNPDCAGWNAKDVEGKVIGVCSVYIDETGVQHLGSLYVAKEWHGKGVADALTETALDWFDQTKPVVLGVVSYNSRARSFYKRWGFQDVEGSERLFDGKIPEVMMEREGRHA
jgi:GNAT superfamily N-acetyltransferase